MKIAVIGLGLIGGSIFKDLTKLGYDVIGISQSQKNIPNVFYNYEKLSDCELIFVCKEMNKTVQTLKNIEPYTKSDTIAITNPSLFDTDNNN